MRTRDWEQRRGSPGCNPSPRLALWAQNLRSLPFSASGRKTSPVRPPLAISGRILRRVRGALSSYIDFPDVEAYNLRQSKPGPQSKRVDKMVTGIAGRGRLLS